MSTTVESGGHSAKRAVVFDPNATGAMQRRVFLKRAGLGLAALCLPEFVAAEKGHESGGHPNIVLIIADDMGYGDLGYTGCRDIRTPNLDRLKAGGTFLTDAYVSGPICVPSRMGMMTGRHQARWGVYDNNAGYTPEGLTRTAAETTIAEIFQKDGYATGIIGKWHLCGNGGKWTRPETFPDQNGFDEVTVIPAGMSSYRAGVKLMHEDAQSDKAPEYLTDHFGKLAASFVDRHKARPFFLCLAFNAVHAPLQALDEDTAEYDEISVVPRRIYAGMMKALDRNVGRVLDALDSAGLEENTVVAFLSDNGGPAHDAADHSRNLASNGPLRGYKFDVWEGGIRSPLIMKWPGHIPAGKRFAGISSSMDLGATFLAAAGLPAPADKPLDGVDLLPFLKGAKNGNPHSRLFWECTWYKQRDCAVREGKWKLIQLRAEDDGPDPAQWQLFDLEKDLGEKQDVAAQHPDVVKRLDLAFRTWREEMAANIVKNR